MNLRKIFRQHMPCVYWAMLVVGVMVVLPGTRMTVPLARGETIAAEKTPQAKVENENADWQKLIQQAKPGAVVTLPAGVYGKPITIDKPLTLKASEPTKCILEVTADQPALMIASKGRVVVEGLTIKWHLATSGQPQGLPCAVAAKDSKATIQNCQILALGGFKRSPSGVQCQGFSDVNLQKCRFEGFNFCINYAGGAEGKVTDCVVLKPGHCGITVYSDSKIEVARTIVTGSGYHGIRSTGGTLAAYDNLIAKNNNRGIYLGNKPARGYVRNNIILSNASGISAFGQSKVAVTNNLILNSSYVGLDTRDSCQLTVKNNIFQGNAKGVILVAEGGKSKVKFGKNSFWENGSDTENLEIPRGSLTVDPRFRAPEQGDYTAQAKEVMAEKQGLSNPDIVRPLLETWAELKSDL